MAALSFLPRWWLRLSAWWSGRNFRLLVQGLPALLLGPGALLLTGFAYLTPQHELEARYFERAQQALKDKDYDQALTCYDRLGYLGSDRPDILYGLALTAEALQQPERALVLMNELAPLDRQGYAPAHYWLGRQLLLVRNPTPALRRAAEAHLLRALDGGIEDPEAAHGMLGEMYLRTERLEQAEFHLEKSLKTKPQLRLLLAQLYARRGDRDRARSEAYLVANSFKHWARADLRDANARLIWAESTLLLEDFAGAVEILQEGFDGTGDERYRTALAQVYVDWARFVLGRPKAQPGDALALLEKALKHDPTHAESIAQVAELARLRGPGADEARAMLRGQLAQGRAPAMIHFLLGTDALEQGKTAEAIVHLEQSHQLAPEMAPVLNNLAWALAQSQPPDLSRALRLINLAVERWPESSAFRHTRSQIYVKLGRWREALSDLQTPRPAHVDELVWHQTNALVYENLKLPEMAAEHRQRATDLQRARTRPGGMDKPK